MKAIYVGGGQSYRKKSGIAWKIYLFLFILLAVVATTLKLAGPMIVEKWINQKGAHNTGYSFSIRDVELALSKGQVGLKDVKVFDPQTNTELVEAPNLIIQVDWQDLLFSHDIKVSLNADVVDVTLSKDLSSVMEKVKAAREKERKAAPYLNALDGKIAKLNIIEKKEDNSRTVLELNDVNVKVKDVTPLAINKKTEFNVTSSIADGGKLNLTGKTVQENGKTPWSIQGTMKEVPSDIFNKIAGDKLPFAFSEQKLTADISAQSANGKVVGELQPKIDRVNLLEDRPGIQSQPIKRLLNEDLTFSLPFTLKDQMTVEYEDTYHKLKTYRRGPATSEAPAQAEAAVPATRPAAKAKTKSFSLWPF